jgi:hypothetical protein
MSPGRSRRRAVLASVLALGCWSGAHGCGITLTDDLAGRPCKDGRCLSGYVCNSASVCVLDTGSGGAGGTDNPPDSSGGDAGTGSLGEGGVGGTGGEDADIPDVRDDRADVSNGGSGGTAAGSAGTSGSAGTGGSAGTADGSAGSGASGGTDGGSNPWPGVGCRQLTCDASAVCCVRNYPGYPTVPPPTGFVCDAPTADNCQFTLRCDGDHDCPRGQQCCVYNTAGGYVASCETTCVLPRVRVECTKPEHCSGGLECCGDWNFSAVRFNNILCRAACNNFNDRAFCASIEDCSGTQRCLESASLPGFQVCQ